MNRLLHRLVVLGIVSVLGAATPVYADQFLGTITLEGEVAPGDPYTGGNKKNNLVYIIPNGSQASSNIDGLLQIEGNDDTDEENGRKVEELSKKKKKKSKSSKKKAAKKKAAKKKAAKKKAAKKAAAEKKAAKKKAKLRKAVVSYALSFKGKVPYVWGGESLRKGVDCSGFVQQVYKYYGKRLPRSSKAQGKAGKAVDTDDRQPGDLIYYGGHIGIYIGNNKVVHASNKKEGIKVSKWNYRKVKSIRRII